MLYSELQCSEAIHKAVERMGFAEMTEVQEKTIPVMLAGRDVIAKAPTGTGKTCAFGIPVAEHIDPALKAPQAVILAPTRELAQQIAEELTGLTYFMPEVQVVCVYGGANMEKQAKRLAEGCQIVVATPGRLMDHYKHHNIDLDHVTQVVLDEADEMLDLGFLPDVERLTGMTPSDKQTLMFSATMPAQIIALARAHLNQPVHVRAEGQDAQATVPDTTQFVYQAQFFGFGACPYTPFGNLLDFIRGHAPAFCTTFHEQFIALIHHILHQCLLTVIQRTSHCSEVSVCIGLYYIE